MLALAINCRPITAIALHCRFEMVVVDSVQTYTCSAILLIETLSDRGVTAIFGAHASGKDNQNVQGLNIISQNLAFFPTNIEEFFPSLGVIDLSCNSIQTVSNTDLSPLPNLWYVRLSNNRISTLDRNLFVGLNALRVVNLSENEITSIDGNLFASLNGKSSIDLSNNRIRSFGHELVLPKDVYVQLLNNTCVSTTSKAHDDVAELKFYLLIHCPPTISLIESSLESRSNFITGLLNRVANLERIVAENTPPAN